MSNELPKLDTRHDRTDKQENTHRWWRFTWGTELLDGILRDFTKLLQKHKSKLWVEITSSISCLQKHSHPLIIHFHTNALENFDSVTEERPSLKQDMAVICQAAHRIFVITQVKQAKRETTFPRAKLQKSCNTRIYRLKESPAEAPHFTFSLLPSVIRQVTSVFCNAQALCLGMFYLLSGTSCWEPKYVLYLKWGGIVGFALCLLHVSEVFVHWEFWGSLQPVI